MSLNLGGGSQFAAIKFGSTNVVKVYAGEDQVWPGFSSPIQYVSSSVTGGTTPSIPFHQVGDLIVVIAQGSATGGASAPTLPTGGWTQAFQSPAGAVPLLVGWKIATSTTTSGGTWSLAAWTTAYVFRGMRSVDPIRVSVGGGSTPASPLHTLTDKSGNSCLAYYYYNNGSTGSFVTDPPAGFVAKNRPARVANNHRYDSTTAPIATESHSTAGVNWRTAVLEILV